MTIALTPFRPVDTQIPCPRCSTDTLRARLGCLSVDLSCPGCRRAFLMSELAGQLDEATFGQLAELVGDRYSDRV